MQTLRAWQLAHRRMIVVVIATLAFCNFMSPESLGQIVSGRPPTGPHAVDQSAAKDAEESFNKDWAPLLARLANVSPAGLAEFKAEYLESYVKGCEEAGQELNERRATIYVSGLRNFFEWLDRKTGLPYKAIAGCTVKASDEGRSAGHNDRISAYIREHGLPPNSFKRWEKELFDLKGFCEVWRKDQSPIRLTPGGPAAKSPDGTHEIRVMERPFETSDRGPAQGLTVVIVDARIRASRLIPLLWIRGEIKLFWGPKDSGFAVIRGEENGDVHYLALDLMRGESLREEHHLLNSLPHQPQDQPRVQPQPPPKGLAPRPPDHQLRAQMVFPIRTQQTGNGNRHAARF